MINLYTIFHANLNFSLIDESEYPEVIKRCYRPLLWILERNKKLKIGFELSGNTLLRIAKFDYQFIAELKKLSPKALQERSAELGIPDKLKTQNEIIRAILKAHAEKQGLRIAEGILDLSRGAFEKLAPLSTGIIRIKLEAL